MSTRALVAAAAVGLGFMAGVLLIMVFRSGADSETPRGIFDALGRFGFASGVVCLGSLVGAFVAFGDRLRGEGERALVAVCTVVAIISGAMMVTLLAMYAIGPERRPADRELRRLQQ